MPFFNLAGKYSDAFGGILQGARDFVLDRVAPRPEALFIKAMTGGAPTQTTMNPTELGKIKDAFYAQKKFALKSDQEVLQKMTAAYQSALDAQKKNPNSPFGPLMHIGPPTLEMAQQVNANAKKAQENPVVNLYGHGRDMRMAYGNLSVFPQPDGGVRIYDRWKVDKNFGGQQDTNTRVGDLQEGGPLPSLLYNAANKLGLYKPFDIDVTIPGDQWNQINRIGPEKPEEGEIITKMTPEKMSEKMSELMKKGQVTNQGALLNALNSHIERTQPGPPVNASPMFFTNIPK